MSLFTGVPNPGYPGFITFTPTSGSTVTLPANLFQYRTNMNWQEAPIFNEAGLMDHSKGLSQGTLFVSGIWDTGLNIMDTISVGDQGTLIAGLNANPDEMNCNQAKVRDWNVDDSAPGQVTWQCLFIIDGSWNDFSGGTANNPDLP